MSAVVLVGLIWQFGGDSKPTDPKPPLRWRSSRLTSLAGIQSEPSLSPDGQRFLFVDYSSPLADIYEQRVGGARANNLTEGSGAADYQPAYSPNGQRIAFRSERDGGGLYVMEATGENVRKIVGEGFMPSWSPDGDRVAYCTTGFSDPSRIGLGGFELRIADLATGALETLDQAGFQPSWSPGGRRIALMGLPILGQRDIGTIPVEGGEPVWITEDPALDWSPRWAPDGRFLYFASNRGGAHNIWRVAIDEETGEALGNFQNVTSGGTELQGFLSITADGRSIVYAARQDFSNLMAAPYDQTTARVTGPPVAITAGPRSLALFDISPDGEWIAYMRTFPWEAYSKQTTWRFPRDSQGRMFAPVDWSSDGRRILGSLLTPGAPDTVTAIYDLDSGAYELAPIGVGDEAFLGDDHHLVWADRGKLMLHDLRTGETRELLSTAPAGAMGPMLSPDGKTLYFLQRSASADIHLLVAEDPK